VGKSLLTPKMVIFPRRKIVVDGKPHVVRTVREDKKRTPVEGRKEKYGT